jgi:peptidase E
MTRSSEPTIVTLGGGGFSQEDDQRLDRYILTLTGKARPNVCFVPTAGGDSESYMLRFYAAFSALECRPTHLSLFRRNDSDLAAFIRAQDVIYVGGGNTANLLAIWRIHGLDRLLSEAWQRGTILCGVSAGAICWFESGVTDSFGPGLAPLHDGLALLPGSFCPHYDGEALRRPRYHELVAAEHLPAGHAADDGVALVWYGTNRQDVVSSRQGSRAFRVERGADGRARETEIAARWLGS